VQFFINATNFDVTIFDECLRHTYQLNIAKLLIDKGACNCNSLSPQMAFDLFNDGYEIDSPYITKEMRNDFINTTHTIIKNSINTQNIPLYDINITGIICEYIAYGMPS
jgi:hypothetical protein